MTSTKRASRRPSARRKKAPTPTSTPPSPSPVPEPPLPPGSVRRIRSCSIFVDIETLSPDGKMLGRVQPTQRFPDGRVEIAPVRLFESDFPDGFEDLLFSKLGLDRED